MLHSQSREHGFFVGSPDQSAIGFALQVPTRWRFGMGVLSELGREAGALGSRVLLMSGRRAMRELGVLDRVLGVLGDSGLEVELFEGVSANPRTDEVEEAVLRGRGIKADVVIGLGGGSVLDAAKAAGAALSCGVPVGELLQNSTPIDRSVPVVAVPTTAGTGSELSRGAILTDHGRRFKGGLRGNGLFPAVALVDPELSMMMPDALARLTGFDVLCHAVETYFSRQSHAMLHSLSLGAVAVVRDCLMRPVAGLEDRVRAMQMAYASSMMGINLGNATTCLPHRMQYAIGALTDTSHPEGLAALYPEWFAAVVKADPVKARRLLGVLFSDAGEAEEAFGDPTGAMIRVLGEIGVSRTLQELGVKSEEDLRWCISHVSGASAVDPAYAGGETIEQIFLSAFKRGC
jgi:alcohol dehydrogenase class IV